MRNERLRATMIARGITNEELAAEIQVDAKSVERWVRLGRIPRQSNAVRAAQVLSEDVNTLWPALRQSRPARAVSPEVVALYAQRADLPVSVFIDLFRQARERLEVLVYAAIFLHEAFPRLNDLIRERADEGCTVRILLGDSRSPNVRQRGLEEEFGLGIEARCEIAARHYRPLVGVRGIDVRTHGTTLYNSIYRADDEMLVNAHVWGVNAYGAPVWHLRRNDERGAFDAYAESFDAIWRQAKPLAEGADS